MAELQVPRKTIKEFLENKKFNFLIPGYQRPYSWTEVECGTLWDDLLAFAFPEENYSKFDNNDEYFLGPIETFLNEDRQMEVIDGQQRLISLMLLLRAFYNNYQNMQDPETLAMQGIIGRCIWKTDEFGNLLSSLKIDSESINDDDKQDFFSILTTGLIADSAEKISPSEGIVNDEKEIDLFANEVSKSNEKKEESNYVKNYRFFQMKVEEFIKKYPNYFSYLPARILNNVIIFPIETSSEESATDIFFTLNNRGLQLSDSDIFKFKFYKYYSKQTEKFANEAERKNFVKQQFDDVWKDLEKVCNKIFKKVSGNPLDELFIRYMYYERAKREIKDTTTISLRKFYENPNKKAKVIPENSSKEKYGILNEQTFRNLIDLADFWKDVYSLNNLRFSEDVLRRLFILKYAPNNLWTGITSVYFMINKDEDNLLNDDKFSSFLEKITAFIFAYAITNPGVNALRTPIYAEMVKLMKGENVDFCDHKFDAENTKNMFLNFAFYNSKPITKALLTWWAFHTPQQKLTINSKYQIEHIFANNRNSDTLLEKDRESLGNKSLLESRINIRASDYRFADKKEYYLGQYQNKNGKKQEGTDIQELWQLANEKDDFTERDIAERNETIICSFIEHLRDNDLVY